MMDTWVSRVVGTRVSKPTWRHRSCRFVVGPCSRSIGPVDEDGPRSPGDDREISVSHAVCSRRSARVKQGMKRFEHCISQSYMVIEMEEYVGKKEDARSAGC